MTRAEAYQVLGLKPGATEEEIRAAYHRLMRAAHPDAGGSDWLAARINQARDVLLAWSTGLPGSCRIAPCRHILAPTGVLICLPA